jgi:cell division protein FtsL
MNRAQKIIQAYRNTPWRRQAQMIGTFAAFGVVAALVMIAYIWVTSNAGTYGLQVQEIQETNRAISQEIEDAKAELADLTSNEKMAVRATEMGFVPINPNRVRYVVVSGYTSEPTPALAEDTASQTASEPNQLPAEFTTSLIDWLSAFIYKLSLKTGSAMVGGE